LKLLISSTNLKEAQEAIAGGADIIDVKNPKEGALGASSPWIIRQIKEATPKGLEVSCTIGEAPNQPSAISLAALGAASLGVDYIKVGLGGIRTLEEAACLLCNVSKAAKECNPQVKVVAVGYADAQKIGGINPLRVPEVAHDARVDVAMLDTAVKNGQTLLDHLSINELKEFLGSAHGFGLRTALAGLLRKQDLPAIYRLGADIAGLRGAACSNSDRVGGEIMRELVEELVATLRQAQTQSKRA
jgi:uncharacterized protein (UPF0264 family)